MSLKSRIGRREQQARRRTPERQTAAIVYERPEQRHGVVVVDLGAPAPQREAIA